MFGTFQIIFYNSNNTQTSIWRITWELQLTYTCTRFGLPRFVSNWERLTTCSKRSRIGECGTSLFSNGFLVALLVHSFRLFSCYQTFYSESIADLIEDSDGWWRSLNSFKPCKTWEDCPVDITFEQVTVFFAKNFTRCRILMSLVELCKFRTLSTPVYGKHRHSYRKFWRLRSPSQYPTTLVAILRGQRAVYLDLRSNSG